MGRFAELHKLEKCLMENFSNCPLMPSSKEKAPAYAHAGKNAAFLLLQNGVYLVNVCYELGLLLSRNHSEQNQHLEFHWVAAKTVKDERCNVDQHFFHEMMREHIDEKCMKGP